jgi:3',5'-cyclic AMP phosphodiesterase CpdA
MVSYSITRRELLVAAGAAATTALIAPGRLLAKPEAVSAFRFAHLADIHLMPEKVPPEGFRRCLRAVHALKPRPDFILTGGDLIMDALNKPEAEVRAQFELFVKMTKDSDIPFRHCIGNHEVFGWSSKGTISPDHAQYGKKMVRDYLQLDRLTYSFDHKGWHFAVVDSIKPVEGGYQGGVSPADLTWLAEDLAAAGARPKVICTHIPFVSLAAQRNAKQKPEWGNVGAPRYLVCDDPAASLKLCREQKVTMVLAGHLHQNERLQYVNTTHITQGAVSGGWWKGPHHEAAPGFGVIDVLADGTFQHNYHTYEWQAEQR